MLKTLVIKTRRGFSRYPRVINAIDHRPHWARVLEALQYGQYIDRETSYDEIEDSNTRPLGLSVRDYKDTVTFLNRHELIDFPPEEGAAFKGTTIEGFELIRDRQRTKSQAKQNRATNKLTLALVLASTVTLLEISGWPLWIALLGLACIGLTVIYDILIRDY